MGSTLEVQSVSGFLPIEKRFNQVFGGLRADVTAMRSQYMRLAYCHDHNVWHELHDIEKALLYAEAKMSDLSRGIVSERPIS
jgi:hypothetical protein